MNLRVFLKCALGRGLIFGPLLAFLLQIQAGADVWEALQNRYAPESFSKGTEKQGPRHDPWARLRAIYLPFSEAIETAALTDHKAARKVSGHLHKALRPYAHIINDAARRFLIPSEIIGAVIMAESGGNSRAQASTSTAKGLMQTIAGTFRDAREDLMAQGILIEDDPFDPQASIIAGAWYLDRMYRQAAMDRKRPDLKRQDIASWRYPVEYYYAGPGHGRKKKKRVIIYAGGKQVVIDKPAYSRKVLKWAKIMGSPG
jgi:soluble lytic murein transglycosylase-like protein